MGVKDEPAERTALYRFYDASGRLLYIGITSHPKDRWAAHKYASWAEVAVRRTVEWLPDWTAAEAAERTAIEAEKPIYNEAHNFDHVAFPPPHWPRLADAGRQKAVRVAALIRAEIHSGDWRPGQKIPSAKALASALGIGPGATNHAIQVLRRERVVHSYKNFGYFVSIGRLAPEQHNGRGL